MWLRMWSWAWFWLWSCCHGHHVLQRHDNCCYPILSLARHIPITVILAPPPHTIIDIATEDCPISISISISVSIAIAIAIATSISISIAIPKSPSPSPSPIEARSARLEYQIDYCRALVSKTTAEYEADNTAHECCRHHSETHDNHDVMDTFNRKHSFGISTQESDS